MQNELQVILTETRDGKPLATVRNFPGLDADMTPAQLRALAGALHTAADDCEAQATRKRSCHMKRSYPLDGVDANETQNRNVPIFSQADVEKLTDERRVQRESRLQQHIQNILDSQQAHSLGHTKIDEPHPGVRVPFVPTDTAAKQ